MGKITKKAKVTVADAKDKVKAREETKDKVASSSTSIGSTKYNSIRTHIKNMANFVNLTLNG
jgi:hypothetical protein